MNKRFLLVLPLALLLTACGSSEQAQPSAPATTPAPTQTPAETTSPVPAASTPAATSAAPESVTEAAPATPVSGNHQAAETDTSQMDAAAKAARAEAAKNFVDTGKWVEGRDYFLISPQQPKVTNTDKIEVVEVFSYGCPACNAAHQTVDKLRKELPAYATMAYLPASFNPQENWVLYQRAYLAAKALGVAAESYDAFFDATWKSGELATYNLGARGLKPKEQWPTLDDVAKFYTRYGVPAEQFKAVAKSFTINTKMKRADTLVKAYGVRATPTIVIDGKYRFSFVDVGTYAKGIELAKWLVAKEAAGK